MSNRMKRLAAPRAWKIPRKTHKWAPHPSPGPHPVESSIPLIVAIRDMLHLADNAREAKRVIAARKVMVDGRVITDHRFPLGFMDVLEIREIDAHYRVLLDPRGNIRVVEIPPENAGWKLVRIENKTAVRGGRIQLNLHDGRNILLEENAYRTGDVLKIAVPSQEIQEHYPLAPGSLAMITGGSHAGKIARIEEYVITRSPKPNVVRFEGGFETIKQNVFVVGVNKPEVVLPEVSIV